MAPARRKNISACAWVLSIAWDVACRFKSRIRVDPWVLAGVAGLPFAG
jgi:hypothetical protein